jgi:hypothetical protein
MYQERNRLAWALPADLAALPQDFMHTCGAFYAALHAQQAAGPQGAWYTLATAFEVESRRQYDTLARELAPAQAARVRELLLARSLSDAADYQADRDRLVEGLAAHFGSLAPVIRALAAHLTADDPEHACRDRCAHPWPYTGARAAAAPDA